MFCPLDNQSLHQASVSAYRYAFLDTQAVKLTDLSQV